MLRRSSQGLSRTHPRTTGVRIRRNLASATSARNTSRRQSSRLAGMRPSPGDLIYPRYGTIGENRLVNTHRESLVSYSCAVIKVMDGFVDPKFQSVFSISDCCRDQAKAAENKTTQANVGIQSIQEFLFPLPPLEDNSGSRQRSTS